jgi:hypothetical protein
VAAAVAVALTVSPAFAGERGEDDGATHPGLLPAAAAVVPGLVLHGSGLHAAGDTRGAARLLTAEGIGVAAILAGVVPLAATGASRRISIPTIPLVIAGSGVFATSFLADVYGAAGGPAIAGSPQRSLPGLELSLGYAYVDDPQFAFGSFAVAGARLWVDRVRLVPSAWAALTDDNQRFRGEVDYRFIGPRAGGRAADGSFLDLRGAVTNHHFGPEDFTVTSGELEGVGRLDLSRLSGSLAGAFAELGVGLGLDAYRYGVTGAGTDVDSLLLSEFGFGLYLGDPAARSGEVRVYYQHRRDGFSAGLATTTRGNGFVGHFGIDGVAWLSDHLGATAAFVVGSSYLTRLGVVFRSGRGGS